MTSLSNLVISILLSIVVLSGFKLTVSNYTLQWEGMLHQILVKVNNIKDMKDSIK